MDEQSAIVQNLLKVVSSQIGHVQLVNSQLLFLLANLSCQILPHFYSDQSDGFLFFKHKYSPLHIAIYCKRFDFALSLADKYGGFQSDCGVSALMLLILLAIDSEQLSEQQQFRQLFLKLIPVECGLTINNYYQAVDLLLQSVNGETPNQSLVEIFNILVRFERPNLSDFNIPVLNHQVIRIIQREQSQGANLFRQRLMDKIFAPEMSDLEAVDLVVNYKEFVRLLHETYGLCAAAFHQVHENYQIAKIFQQFNFNFVCSQNCELCGVQINENSDLIDIMNLIQGENADNNKLATFHKLRTISQIERMIFVFDDKYAEIEAESEEVLRNLQIQSTISESQSHQQDSENQSVDFLQKFRFGATLASNPFRFLKIEAVNIMLITNRPSKCFRTVRHFVKQLQKVVIQIINDEDKCGPTDIRLIVIDQNYMFVEFIHDFFGDISAIDVTKLKPNITSIQTTFDYQVKLKHSTLDLRVFLSKMRSNEEVQKIIKITRAINRP